MTPHKTKVTAKQSTTPIEPAQKPAQDEAKTRQAVQRLLEQQQYAEALTLIAAEYGQNGPGHLTEEYLQAMNGCLDQSGDLMQGGRFAEAAQLLKTARDNYPADAASQKSLSKTRNQITKSINICTESMVEKGLRAYRSGELSAAIEIWEQVLAVDPKHLTARDSIQTTRTQLSKLKDLNGQQEELSRQ